MIDPQQLQSLARYMEQYHNMLQSAQETVKDPAMRAELKALQTFLRDTHAQVQDEAKKFNSEMEARIQQVKQRRDEAEKKIAEADAQRQKVLEELAARQVKFQEIDPLLLEKIRSDLMEDFGNRDRPKPNTSPIAAPVRPRHLWQDWPETEEHSPDDSTAPPQPSKEAEASGAVRPYQRLIDAKLGEELRRALLADVAQTPIPPPRAEPAKDVWQDWP